MANSKPIRKPAVAGYFYPRDAGSLADEIDRMIDSAEVKAAPGQIRVLVSPHAGYRYSGSVAAYGYRLLRRQDIHTAVVISPSHIARFGHSAVYDGGGYETPLGLAVTSDAISHRVASVNESVVMSDDGHVQTHLPRQEHALEVQIPFLQRTLDKFELVAIVMGDQNWAQCVALGEALKPLVEDPGVVFVASTDLSHFYDASRANRLDQEFRDVLTTMDAAALYESVQKGCCEACGAGPVISSLLATEGVTNRSLSVLAQKNSGDTTGDYSSVVGYLSAVVTSHRHG
jgi:AmmeMemoRadiSam system protein B